MSGKAVRKYCVLGSDAEAILRQAMGQLGLSARAHDKILKIARTIADLEPAQHIRAEHVTEAIHYRRLDRQL
jgi:magnesium chelatase family protein